METKGHPTHRAAVGEVAAVFARLGTIAFGGPAAHIAMMREEVVVRRRWVTEQRFLDLMGLTNLIPGPNSTEMAIHLGYARGGWPGLVVAGAAFILPASLIVLALAWAYVTYGSVPQAQWLLYGIKPVVVAVVAQAIAALGRTAIRSPRDGGWAAAILALYALGTHELVLLFGGGLLYAAVRQGRAGRAAGARLPLLGSTAAAGGAAAAAAGGATGAGASAAGALVTGAPFSLSTLFWVLLKIGSVLYGSGYVLLAFLQRDLVQRLGWLTGQQLLDAVSVGQFTPGPVFTTATFIGYVLGGWPGAALATLGIFLPSFAFVAAIHPLGERLRRLPWTAAFLDGVNLAGLALMAGVTLQLARDALVDGVTWVLAGVALVALLRRRVNSAWLIAAGAAAGAAVRFFVAQG